MSKKMWGGRFDLPTDKFVEEFGAVIHMEKHLCPFDIRGSIAHATMLGRQGIIPQQDAETIIKGLRQVGEEIEAGAFVFRSEDEDIHMAIEKRLTEIVGAVGGKLHTARSRNDQCTVDAKMHLRSAIRDIQQRIEDLQSVLLSKAEQHFEVIMPGYTHLQTAQPILFAHWIMTYFQMLRRDHERFGDILERHNLCPLGAAALAGTTFPIDRHFTANELGFRAPTENSLDSVSDRDYYLDFMAGAAICAMHLSRFCEELVIYCSQDFKFIEFSDDYSTGSSIMPQKKNPDIAELIRGKAGRMYGDLIAMLTIMKGTPLAYNKDMMEDKEIAYDSIATITACLKIMAPMINKMSVNGDNMRAAANRGFSTATDMADYLVRKNLPFREAHHAVGKAVNYCIQKQKLLDELSLEEFRSFHPSIDADIYEAISLEASVAARTSYGGTAPQAVRVQIQNGKAYLTQAAKNQIDTNR